MVRKATDTTLLFTVMCTLVRVVHIMVVPVMVANLLILAHQDRDTISIPVMNMHTEKDRSLLTVAYTAYGSGDQNYVFDVGSFN